MRERVEAVGGSVTVQSEPSRGVTVLATVPVEGTA
jgi:signal transduction histidine kinase